MKHISIILAVVCIVFFAILSKYEDRPGMRNLDFAVTVKVQESIDKSSHLRVSAVVENVLEGATFFAAPEWTLAVSLLMTVLLVYDFRKKRWNLRGLVVPVLLVGIVIAEVYGKTVVHHPSPPFAMIKHPTTLFPADYINDQFSFPSGHAARAVFIAGIVYGGAWLSGRFGSLRRSVLLSLILLAYVGVVCVSRIYLGHHWFSDVVGGVLLGSGCVGLMLYWLTGAKSSGVGQ